MALTDDSSEKLEQNEALKTPLNSQDPKTETQDKKEGEISSDLKEKSVEKDFHEICEVTIHSSK